MNLTELPTMTFSFIDICNDVFYATKYILLASIILLALCFSFSRTERFKSLPQNDQDGLCCCVVCVWIGLSIIIFLICVLSLDAERNSKFHNDAKQVILTMETMPEAYSRTYSRIQNELQLARKAGNVTRVHQLENESKVIQANQEEANIILKSTKSEAWLNTLDGKTNTSPKLIEFLKSELRERKNDRINLEKRFAKLHDTIAQLNDSMTKILMAVEQKRHGD